MFEAELVDMSTTTTTTTTVSNSTNPVIMILKTEGSMSTSCLSFGEVLSVCVDIYLVSSGSSDVSCSMPINHNNKSDST